MSPAYFFTERQQFQKPKSKIGCLKYFFREKNYAKKQYTNFHVLYIHHSPV